MRETSLVKTTSIFLSFYLVTAMKTGNFTPFTATTTSTFLGPARVSITTAGNHQQQATNWTSSPSTPRGGKVRVNRTHVHDVRRNIIRGSDSAVTITKMKYLKKEMCKSAPLHQAVRERGCVRRLIVNRFCYGQCNSFFIPKTVPSRDDVDAFTLEETAFKSCSFCRPKAVRWIRVLLQCPKLTPPTRRKKVQIVMECSCTALPLN